MIKAFIAFATLEIAAVAALIVGHLYDNSHTTGPADTGDNIMLWSLAAIILLAFPTVITGALVGFRKIKK